MDSLVAFRGEDITEDEIKRIEPIVNDEGFTVENMKSKSAAAANLCSWVISIYTFNRIYVKVSLPLGSLQRVLPHHYRRPQYRGGLCDSLVVILHRVPPASVVGRHYVLLGESGGVRMISVNECQFKLQPIIVRRDCR